MAVGGRGSAAQTGCWRRRWSCFGNTASMECPSGSHRCRRNQPAQPVRRVRLKEELFARAVERYLAGPGVSSPPRSNGRPRGTLPRPLSTEPPTRYRPGPATRVPLLIQGALAAGEDADTVRTDLARRRDAAVTELVHRFDEAQAAGELPGVHYQVALLAG